MSATTKKRSPSTASASTDAADTSTVKPAGANATLQASFDEANAQGYFGTVPDQPANEAYTVAGVTKGVTS